MSKLYYADAVTGPRLLSKTKRLLQRVQNSCARFCFDIPRRAHVSPYLNKHSLLKMRHRHKLHLACLMFGVIKTKIPSYLHEKLTWRSELRGRRRCCPQLTIQRHCTAAFRGSFRYSASKCWNNIPPPIRDLKSIFSFKHKLKIFLLVHQNNQELRQDTSAI